MRRSRPLSLVLPLLALAAAPAWAQPLPTDPDLVTGELENGLDYIVLRHAVPPERATLWLHVSTGSLNETDDQRGLAHFLEHLAFNGSENFPPGSVIPFFESLGLTFGQHQNAFTSFDQTVYQLALPAADEPTIDKGMTFLADVAGRLSLLPEEIENERQVILEERRSRLGGDQRVQEYILERLAPGSTIGLRLPIGVEETITTMDREDFQRYYNAWYVPSNMTLMVAADADPELIVAEITEHFAGLADGRALPAPQDRDPGVEPQREPRAIVASDPELTGVTVGFMRVDEPRPPITTVEQLREALVERIGAWVFNRRAQQKTAEGAVAWRGAGASAEDWFNAVRVVNAQAMASDPALWPRMLEELGTEIQRARLHGFTERELEDARAALIAQAERAAEREDTLPARARLAAINSAVAEGEPITSAEQDLALLREILPTITLEEVSKTFAEVYDPAAVTFVLQIPSGADVPGEDDLLAAGRAAFDVAPEAEAEAERPTTLMETAPTPGELTDLAEHVESGVWSGWLSSGVRVHYRFMNERKDQAAVVITLAGGQIQETEANRGISEAAAVAWSRPATGRLSSTNIRDLLTGKKVGVSGGAGTDTMTLTVSGSPADLETGLQLAHLLLTDPKIEPAAFEQWKQIQRQIIADRRLTPDGAFGELAIATLYPPDEPRTRMLTTEDVDRLTIEEAQAWLTTLIASAPIEVAVVGDIERERALELVRTYLGSLPPRERIGSSTLDHLRAIDRPEGPLVGAKEMPTRTDKAYVLAGFFGPDIDAVRDTRLISTAARILSTRMIQRLREREQLVYSISAGASPGTAFPGYGTFEAFSSTAPDKVPALLDGLKAMFDEFAAQGPTEEEVRVAQRQIANTLDERLREPGYWQNVLASADYRGIGPAQIINAPADYASFTADQIKAAFNRYYRPESAFRVQLTPAPQPAAPGTAQDATEPQEGGT